MHHVLPTISIELAPTEPEYEITADIVDELPQITKDAEEFYRPTHLAPPPILSPIRGTQALQKPSNKKGLEKERFEQLLKASRERTRATTDLRKEVALKAHKSKQFERRALFLSKVEALPSFDAANTPATPPESPAVFHFSLPSPGLVSPLALFESLERMSPEEQRKTWVEKIDFRAQAVERKRKAHARIPSLDQITARMTQAPLVATRQQSTNANPRPPIPLPAFLGTRSKKAAPAAAPLPPKKPEINAPLPPIPTKIATKTEAPAPVSRPSAETIDLRRHRALDLSALRTARAAAQPSTDAPRLTVTRASPIRTTNPTVAALVDNKVISGGRAECAKDMVEKLRKRISAPAALPAIKEKHPILMMRGGF
jgi:hypothetical protein